MYFLINKTVRSHCVEQAHANKKARELTNGKAYVPCVYVYHLSLCAFIHILQQEPLDLKAASDEIN